MNEMDMSRAKSKTHRIIQSLRHYMILGQSVILTRIVNRLTKTHFVQIRPDLDLILQGMPERAKLEKFWLETERFPQELHSRDMVRFYLILYTVRTLIEKEVVGAFAEVGVYRGSTAGLIHQIAPDRRLYLFDTFEGFPQEDLEVEHNVTGLKRANSLFSDTDLKTAEDLLGGHENIIFVKGRFPDTVSKVPDDEKFAFVHFDADLYPAAKATCEIFYKKLSPNGVILFHDYNGTYPGIKKAVDEFLCDKPESIVTIPDKCGTAVLVRNKHL